MSEEGRPIAWSALPKGTTVVSADGQEIGKVSSVVADEQKDIFSGIAFRDGILDREVFAPAETIENMTETRVTLGLSAQQVEGLEPYER